MIGRINDAARVVATNLSKRKNAKRYQAQCVRTSWDTSYRRKWAAADQSLARPDTESRPGVSRQVRSDGDVAAVESARPVKLAWSRSFGGNSQGGTNADQVAVIVTAANVRVSCCSSGDHSPLCSSSNRTLRRDTVKPRRQRNFDHLTTSRPAARLPVPPWRSRCELSTDRSPSAAPCVLAIERQVR